MNSKLTLRLDDGLIALAKAEAVLRGKSVSQMVGDFVELLGHVKDPLENLPPITASLRGVLRGQPALEQSYKKHLQEKHR